MTAALLRGAAKIEKVLVIITNFIHILEQCHLVILIVVYAFMEHCSFEICSYMRPTSFDAGLTTFLAPDLFTIQISLTRRRWTKRNSQSTDEVVEDPLQIESYSICDSGPKTEIPSEKFGIDQQLSKLQKCIYSKRSTSRSSNLEIT